MWIYIKKKYQNPLQYVNSPPVVIANNTSQHVNKVCTENPFISFLLRTCICIFQRLGKLSISYLIKNSDYYFFKLSGIFWYHEKAWENNYFPLHHSCQKDRCKTAIQYRFIITWKSVTKAENLISLCYSNLALVYTLSVIWLYQQYSSLHTQKPARYIHKTK